MRSKGKNRVFSFVVPSVIAALLWVILNVSGVQEWFFREASLGTVIFVKISHLSFLLLLSNILFFIFRRSRTDTRYRLMVKIALLYFCVGIILLLLVWPGAWAWDDLGVIKGAESYYFSPWQHFLSGFFQVIALQTLPFASGVIIIQILIASIIVGYIVSFLGNAIEMHYKKKSWLIYLFLILPFFFFPVLYYLLTGYRMAVYQYLEILVFAIILVKYLIKGKINYLWLFIVGILTIIVGAWRTEGLITVLFVPIMLLMIKSSFLTVKKVIFFFVVTLLGTLSIGKINTMMIGNDNYKIGAVVYPLIFDIRNGGDVGVEEIKKIDSVLSVKCMVENNELSEEHLYHKCIKDDYSEQEYTEFMKTSIGILVRNSRETISAVDKMFWQTVGGLYDENGSPYTCSTAVAAANIFLDDTPEKEMWDKVNSKMKNPINDELRRSTINFLAGTPDGKATLVFSLFWNAIVPLVFICVVGVIAIIRKRWIVFVMVLSVLGRTVAIALTAMAPYYMYYMPVYVSSYVLIIFTIVDTYYSLRYKRI